jgi:hypothetical protein
MNSIIMTEEYWVNTQFSIARYYGEILVNGKHYVIVNKHGITLRELSNPRGKHYVGDGNKAIPPGEPADLCLFEWVPVYKALGREKTMELVKEGVTLKEAKKIVSEQKTKKKATK